MARTTTVQMENVNKGGASKTRISVAHYEAMSTALLASVPADESGIPYVGLDAVVEPLLPRELFEGRSVRWYVTSVKLDLEQKGLLERVPGSRPQRIRRRA